MTCEYVHCADKVEVVKLIKGKIYHVLKEIGRWVEITDGKGGSFYVLSEYCKRNEKINSESSDQSENLQELEHKVKRIMVQPIEKSSTEDDVVSNFLINLYL